MHENEKPSGGGPSPSQKAQVALGTKLNRKAKDPPTFPGKKVPNNPIPKRRRDDADTAAK